MGNIKIRSLSDGSFSQVKGTNFVPVALNAVGIPQVTRKFDFNQIVSGGVEAHNLYFKDGRIGIGTAAPGYDLEIDGDVNVLGTLYTGGIVVSSSSSEVSTVDKIIILNSGELGAGVGGNGLAGLAIDRGTLPSGLFLFDETIDKFTTSHGLSLTGDLAVDGSAVFTQDLTALGDLDIEGDTTFGGNVVIDGSINANLDFGNGLDLTGNLSGDITGYFNQLHVSGSDAAWHQINPYLDTEAAFVSGSGFNKIRELEDVNPEYKGTGIYSGDYLAIASNPDSTYEAGIGTRKVKASNFLNAIISEDPRFGGGTDALLPKNLILNVGEYTDLNGQLQSPTDALAEFDDRTMVNMPFGSSYYGFGGFPTLTYEMHVLEAFKTVFGALQWAAKNCGTNLYVGLKIQGKVSMMGTYHNNGGKAPDGAGVTYVKQFQNFNLVAIYGGTRNATTDKTTLGFGRIDYDLDAWTGGSSLGMWFRKPEVWMGNLHWLYGAYGGARSMESAFRHGPSQAQFSHSMKFDFLSSCSGCGSMWKELEGGLMWMFPGSGHVLELGAVNNQTWFTAQSRSFINWSNNADGNTMIFTGKPGQSSHTNCDQRFLILAHEGVFEFVGGRIERGNSMTIGATSTWAYIFGPNNNIILRTPWARPTIYWPGLGYPHVSNPGYGDHITVADTQELLQVYGRYFSGSQSTWGWTNGTAYTNNSNPLPFWLAVESWQLGQGAEIAGITDTLQAPTSP